VRLLIISDTHMPARSPVFPPPLVSALAAADRILHAGDLTETSILDELARFAPVTAVAGNVDSPELRSRLPRRVIEQVGAFRIGMIHGDGPTGSTVARASAAFAFEAVDCIVFGHSHQPLCRRQEGVLFLNPGSPTDKRAQPRYSFAWLTATNTLEAEIIYF
jgi:putative phosphoesterase